MIADICFYWQQVCDEIKKCNKYTHTYLPSLVMIYLILKLSENKLKMWWSLKGRETQKFWIILQFLQLQSIYNLGCTYNILCSLS